MPYNNSAIPPPAEITGQASLPLARVKRIISLDEDISQCSNNAAFVITVATEMFIRYLAERGHEVARSERKPRRNIQYNDLATAVARIDNLEFLSDVIPKTTTYWQFKEKKAREARNGTAVETGQMTLDGKKRVSNGTGTNGYADDSLDGLMNGDHGQGSVEEDDGLSRPTSSSRPSHSLNGAFVDRTAASHAHPHGEDVTMSQ